jgi:hypothetical protein
MQRRRWLALSLTALTSGCLRLAESEPSEDTPASRTAFEIQVADEEGTLQTVVDGNEVASAGNPRERNGSYAVPIELTESGAERLVAALEEVSAFDRPSEHPIFVYFDGQNVYSFQLGRGLVSTMRDGTFVDDPRLVVTLEDQRVARDLSDTLQS